MKEQFSLRTVRKKIILISKLAGVILMISYLISTRLPLEEDISLLLWVIFLILLIMMIDYLLGRFISDPIGKICEMAHRAARLDFSQPCGITSKDEFGELADNLNKMSENLQDTLEKLEKANIRLEEDVQQERKLLRERKELTDRLSHEMKTPIGVIRAYAEGIQDETDEEKRQKYSEIIISETERMSMLIETLLDLSALENGAASLVPERFDFVELAETVAGRLLIDTPEADFELQYELPEHKVFVYTDKQRMEQVLNNFIVNAKKNVSPKGTLRLSVVEQGPMLHFSVYNQGISIPPERLPKIWEKFYRDKDAKYSGSGLGLAIVAQILSMQDLEYGAENLSDGVRFFFSIPIIK
ncbi:sensor histidine kinase [bacterium 1XD21-13]|nr:sensor histidine kinase [bacterium 1XD21-13]